MTRRRLPHLISLFMLSPWAIGLAGCTPQSAAPGPAAPVAPAPAPAASPAPAAPAPANVGIDLAGMDRTVAAGDDFFAHANRTWLKSTEIPSDRSSWGTGAVLAELTAKRTAELIAQAASSAAPGADARKVGDYYASFMDEAAIEARGLEPLRPILTRIAAINNRTALSAYLGSTLRADVDILNATKLDTDNFLGLWVAQDLSDPSRYSTFLIQGGLGLPDRQYYLDGAARMVDIRTRYQAHIGNVLELLGTPKARRPGATSAATPAARAAQIFALERQMAEAHVPRVVTFDVEKGNNHWKRAELIARARGVDWNAFLKAAGLERQKEFVVWQPSAVVGLARLVTSVPLTTWRDYLAYHAVLRRAGVLPRRVVEEVFAFHGKVIAGTPELRARWKRAVAATDDALGEAVGKLYVEKYFPAAEKTRAEAMVKNLLAAFGRRIDSLSWMSAATKARAKAKLAVLKVGVGYPDRWRDYSALQVVRGDAFGNQERASLFDYRRALARLGQPVDRGEWVMNPQLVNAVNLPAMNAMNFPAAILQPPFFDPSRPEVMDYGAIGAVIGHEISHSFDNEGALFDATGRLHNWWTEEDKAHFKDASARLVKQFDAYRPFPDAHVNGRLTLSENIADVAGLAAAYDAYRLSQGGKETPSTGGLSGDQQFFVSFAQSWRNKLREAAARARLVTDGHAPAEYRADTVRNLDPWYAAFSVQPGQKLYLAPAERVRIW
jgi:predicted metalloendopeptidase